jgi:hypothetical protein
MKSLIISILIVAIVIISGCTSPQAPAPINNVSVPPVTVPQNQTQVPVNVTPPPPPVNNTPPVVNNTPNATVAPTSTCNTLAPSCGDCVSKPGCGWCKSMNGCFAGDASGPTSVTCQQVDWATTSTACAGPVGGNTCVSKTNCADCLSGSGCKWCQQGTKCTDAASTDVCASGTWRNTSYECYGGQ